MISKFGVPEILVDLKVCVHFWLRLLLQVYREIGAVLCRLVDLIGHGAKRMCAISDRDETSDLQ